MCLEGVHFSEREDVYRNIWKKYHESTRGIASWDILLHGIYFTLVPSDLCYCYVNVCISFLRKSDLFQAVILLKYALSFSSVPSFMTCIFQDIHQSQGVEGPGLFSIFLMILTRLSTGSKPGPHERGASSSCQHRPHFVSVASLLRVLQSNFIQL